MNNQFGSGEDLMGILGPILMQALQGQGQGQGQGLTYGFEDEEEMEEDPSDMDMIRMMSSMGMNQDMGQLGPLMQALSSTPQGMQYLMQMMGNQGM